MRKSFVALLLLMGAAAALATSAYALTDDLGGDNVNAKLINAQMLRDMHSAVAQTGVSGAIDTTFVGFVPGKVTATNYWGLGVGNFKAFSTNVADYGYWSFDNDAVHNNIGEAHGDSLFGWWPIRNLMNGTGGLTLSDDQRPWWAVDIGNQANEIVSAGTAHKRSFGVVGVWHRDNGSASGGGVSWSALGGSFSLWCGLRRDGDLSFVDPITNNPFNARVLCNNGIAGGSRTSTVSGGIGTDKKFPGYGSQWDQLAYRDLDVTGKPSVTLRFKFRTNMSTAFGTTNATRTGWFDKDPLNHLAPNNFISNTAAGSAAPIDSFMVYVGAPVGGTFVGSDGLSHSVYDPQRRWLSETIRVNEPGIPYKEVFTTFGDHAAATQVSLTAPVSGTWGNKARVVFRSKTNRGFDDETGSISGSYSSGGAGAVVIDDVEVSYDGGTTYSSIGDFEAAGSVDNATGTDPLNAWKTTGKPPGAFHHIHSYDTLVYEDLCGPVGSLLRTCNLAGNVISEGDHDNSEAASGTFGTAEQERWDGVVSPTINLRNGGGTNEMGINDGIANATEDYYIEYDIYTGIFDPFSQGNLWRFGFSAYPAVQSDNQKLWGDWRFPGFIIFNPDKQCFQDQEGGFQNGIIRWSTADAENGVNYPDSIRIFLGKRQECYRFGVTTGCSPTDGAYFDNISFAFVDGPAPPMTIDIWQLINDTFTVNGLNRGAVAPGTANFDTTAALVKTGLNIAQTTGDLTRYDVPGDTTVVNADGANFRMDMVFRISPGPGNYVTAGNRASGLRRVPTSATQVDYLNASNNGNFWAEYLRNNGEKGTVAGHPAGATNGGKDWSSLVWNSARMDTAETNNWLISSRPLFGPTLGLWATMYHESDPKYTKLGLAKNRCWLIDPTGPNGFANITCDIGATQANWPVTAGYVAENGLPLGKTYEYTKILADGYFTPGTHVEYFFRREDNGDPNIGIAPDTNLVFPQLTEGSTDAHRWQEFTVLPDAWKKIAYGGLGQACLLFVDNNDRRGNERVWVSIADSLGATRATKYGAHNGWHQVGKVSLNDPSGFVRNLNEAPGTTWDMLGVKASESLNTNAGSIGADYANHAPSNVDGKWSFEGPSIGMLEAYYKVILLLTGDLNSGILGQFDDKSQNDVRMLREFMLGGTSSDHRGVWVEGDGFVEDTDQSGPDQADLLHNFFKTALRDPSYFAISNNDNQCADLQALAPITTNGDIYGVRNGCTFTDDVQTPGVGGVPATLYSPNGTAVPPLVAGVFHDVNPGTGEFWQSLVDGWDIENLRSRFCDKSIGRLAYYYNALTNIFGKICPIAGNALITTDVPNNPSGDVFVDFMNLRNNPLVSGQATVDFGLAKADRVEVKVFDVSGRLVRTLADRQFAAGRHTLTWDGVDNDGRSVPRGVYFTQVKYVNSRFTDAKKLTVLK
jgi:hypothetical protein